VARAPFLLLPVALVVCGAGAAAHAGTLRWGRTALALVGLIALHAAVNAFNEVSDLRTGIDLETARTPFSGGSGTLPSGRMRPAAAFRFAVAASAVGAAVGIYFLVVVGWVLVPLLLAGAACVLGYTDVLARQGVGEIAAGLGLGTLPVMGTVLVQAGTLDKTGIAAAMPAFFMTFNLLLLNEFPDEAADLKGGRKNLVLMLGRRDAAMVYLLAAAFVPGFLGLSVLLGWLPAAALAACAPLFLLAPAASWALRRPEANVPVAALAGNVAWNLVTNVLLGVILFLS